MVVAATAGALCRLRSRQAAAGDAAAGAAAVGAAAAGPAAAAHEAAAKGAEQPREEAAAAARRCAAAAVAPLLGRPWVVAVLAVVWRRVVAPRLRIAAGRAAPGRAAVCRGARRTMGRIACRRVRAGRRASCRAAQGAGRGRLGGPGQAGGRARQRQRGILLLFEPLLSLSGASSPVASTYWGW